MSGTLLPILAQDYQTTAPTPSSPGLLISVIPLLIALALAVLMIAAMWKVFTKAGKPGWASIIPIYNVIVMLEIAGKPIWWIVLFFIPLVNLIIGIIVIVEFAKRFGQGVGFAVGMIFLPFIFYPILGFGSAQYQSGPTQPRGFAPIVPQAQ